MPDTCVVPETFEALLLRHAIEFSDIPADREALKDFFAEMKHYFRSLADV